MDARRTALACLVAGVLLALLLVLLPDSEQRRTGEAHRPSSEKSGTAPSLMGHGPTAPRTDSASASSADSDEADEARTARLVAHEIEVLDYRSAPVEGVRVFIERDWNDYSSGTHVRGWRVLDQGATNDGGLVRLAADPARRKDLKDGFNHRLRVVPPKGREDLAATWRTWKPTPKETFRLLQRHVVGGVVVDGSGAAIAGATVFIGDLPNGDYAVTNPEWRKTTTGARGRFRFDDLPPTSDWRADVWAIRPGEALPRTSRDVRSSQSVALDDRHVEIRLK